MSLLTSSITAAALRLIMTLLMMSAASAADPFIMSIDTTIAGSSGVKSFLLPLVPYDTYDFSVDWGDGTSQTVLTATSPLHTYTSAATYQVEITELVAGGFPAIYFNNGGDCLKLQQISQWGTNAWASLNSAFAGCQNLVITATDEATANLSNVTDMSDAWYICPAMTSFPALVTTHVSNFFGAWYGCSGLSSFPAIDTSNGTNFFAAWSHCEGPRHFPC